MAPFLNGKRALTPDLPLFQRLPVLRLPASGEMPLNRGLEVAVQELPGAPLILRAQTFSSQRTAAAVLPAGPVFPEQTVWVQSIPIRTDVNIFRRVIGECIPFELRLGPVAGRLGPDKELDPQLLQFPVDQRKIIGRVCGGSLRRNYPLMDSFHLFQIGRRIMDIPRRHGQADDNPMAAVQGLVGEVVLALRFPWPFHMPGPGVCPAHPFLCPPVVFFDLPGALLPPLACPYFECFQRLYRCAVSS